MSLSLFWWISMGRNQDFAIGLAWGGGGKSLKCLGRKNRRIEEYCQTDDISKYRPEHHLNFRDIYEHCYI